MKEENIGGSVALITGGAHGIGEGIARRLTDLGAKVVIADVDDKAGLTLAKDIDAHFVRCDVSDYEHCKAAVAAAESEFGGLDIAILNAGIVTDPGFGENFNPVEYVRAMEINLNGVMFGAQAAFPALKKRGGGDIIATASIAGLLPTPINPTYGANKSGIVGTVRALAPMWEDHGVRVNALCPGFADTQLIEEVKAALPAFGIKMMDVSAVVGGFMSALTSGRTGECWYVLPDLPVGTFPFAEIPGLRSVYPDPASVRVPG